MSKPLIFLSHIHQEKELAMIVKNAIEEEFSGFAEVFVSSDGTSIRAGDNFLNKIEDGLVNCVGGVYLISQASVQKPWINFELGAVWIRNAINLRNDLAGIPALPFCHSDIKKSELPQPISNLNAVEINQASELEFAFQSLQHALGGRGKLRTDFNELAASIRDFEQRYTIGDSIKNFFNTLYMHNLSEIPKFRTFVENETASTITIPVTQFEESKFRKLKDIASNKLPGLASFEFKGSGVGVNNQGSFNFAEFDIIFNVDLLKEYFKLY